MNNKLKLGLVFASLSLLLCSLSVVTKSHAQETDKPASQSANATLFYDSRSSKGVRLDLSEEPGVFRYVEQLRSQRPRDKVVYIAYGPFGEVAWYLLGIRDWLKNNGGVSEDMLFTFDGGRENELRYEAWLVPEGAEMPKVIGPPAEDENAVIKFTDYPYPGECEYCDAQAGLTLGALAEALGQRPQRKAYLEFYPCGQNRRRRLSVARREASEAKQLLMAKGGIAPSRIIVKIKANSKPECEARIWLLPPHLNSLPAQAQR